ncbi:MAG: glycosyltransferase family 4 protein [Rickettsiales bacterium]|jgi:glycosyltransferase involved in cell wall biosynthesis|nr:glycosyltransferase family 4 protein [Rickettsiales bacterium]
MVNKSSLTIMQLVPTMNSGGIERGTIEIADATVKEGFRSIVLTKGGVLESRLTKVGSKVIKLDIASKNPITIWRNINKIVKIIKDEKVDIVHARSRVPAWSAYYACRKTKAKFLTTFHGVYSGTSLLKKKYNSIMTKADLVISISDFITKHMVDNYGVNPKKIRKIYRGVDLKLFDKKRVSIDQVVKYTSQWNVPEDKHIILLPGRLSRWKGQEVLIEALAQIKEENFFCLILGDRTKSPKFTQKLERLIDHHGLSDRIGIYDNVQDILNLYHISHLVISTSTRPEAFGRVMIEAGAMGKIMIATNHGGACETIIDERTGFLVEPNNPKLLASRIKKVINLTKAKRALIKKAAVKHVNENFSIDLMKGKTIEVYKELKKKRIKKTS